MFNHGSLFSGIDFYEAKTLYESGMTQTEVGEKFNVSQKVIFGLFKRNNYKSRIAAKRNQRGENNSSWKNGKITYAAYHYRVQSARGKANHCEECGRSDNDICYDWANQIGHYEDINDYKQMCRSCHFKKDGHKKNFPNNDLIPNENKRKLINGN